MRREVEFAVDFLLTILRTSGLTATQLDKFRQTLILLMCSHYDNHWFPELPPRGSGYRCIRINHIMDPLISKAGKAIGLSNNELFNIFPSEFTLWVDPDDVSYRIGEEGSIGLLMGEDWSSNSGSSGNSNTSSPGRNTPDSHNNPRDFYNMFSTNGGYDQNQYGPHNDFFQACSEQLRHYMPYEQQNMMMDPYSMEYYNPAAYAAS